MKLGMLHLFENPVNYTEQEVGFNEPLCWTCIGGHENSKVLSAMELLGTDIIPAVREASGL